MAIARLSCRMRWPSNLIRIEDRNNMKIKTAASILSMPRRAKIILYGVGTVLIGFAALSIYWSRTPDTFWVNEFVEDDRIVVGYSSTDTLYS